jgi:peptidoglycan-N-acetylglucosamine deacetylase
VFPLTIHPEVSGRPQVLLMLERLLEYISGHLGVRWCTMEEMAEEYRRRICSRADLIAPFGIPRRQR